MSQHGINGWSIQTLLRGENDSKQSDEIQAINLIMYYPCCFQNRTKIYNPLHLQFVLL